MQVERRERPLKLEIAMRAMGELLGNPEYVRHLVRLDYKTRAMIVAKDVWSISDAMVAEFRGRKTETPAPAGPALPGGPDV